MILKISCQKTKYGAISSYSENRAFYPRGIITYNITKYSNQKYFEFTRCKKYEGNSMVPIWDTEKFKSIEEINVRKVDYKKAITLILALKKFESMKKKNATIKIKEKNRYIPPYYCSRVYVKKEKYYKYRDSYLKKIN